MDKFKLVYEFNKESPLITYEAFKEYENKNFDKAIELFETAINKFPYYPTSYFLYAVTLANLTEYEKAKEFIAKGDNLLNSQKTYNYYDQLIEKIRAKNLGIEPELEPDEKFEQNLKIGIDKVDDFDFLNEDEDETESFNSTESQPIVTETLAEIYASQGNFKEALDIYTKLKELKPELREKFDNRIKEINTAIENKKQN